jgi:hypothetical protein
MGAFTGAHSSLPEVQKNTRGFTVTKIRQNQLCFAYIIIKKKKQKATALAGRTLSRNVGIENSHSQKKPLANHCFEA